MKRITRQSEDKRIFECPQCNKRRMRRPIDHVVSLEKREHTAKDNKKISLYVDVCDQCNERNFKKYFEPSKADLKKLLKTMHENATNLGEGQSLEDLL